MRKAALAFCYHAEMICADEVISNQLTSVDGARTGHGAMADLSPLLGEEWKSDFGAVRSVDDPNLNRAAHGYSSKREPLHICNPPVVLHSLS
jgi:hypothetical protein